MVSLINQAAQFEKELTKINTLVGVSQDLVGEWGEQLLELGPALGQTPRELAEALFFITSAGIRDATTSMEVLEVASKAAAIGMGEVKDVANAVTSVMQAYAESGVTAAEATDVLTATVREGKLQAEELAPSIGRVIPIAAEMGVSFQEVGAFIATFTRLGVPAAVAVTSLRSALTAILKPTSAARESLADYGLTMDNVRHTIEEEGLSAALLQLSVIMNDDNEAFGKVIGSARGLTGVLAVTGGLSEDYAKILDNLNNSAGLVAEGFETVSKTTAFMAEQAKSSLQVVAISFGQILLPGINAVLEVVTGLSASFAKLAEANPAIVKTVGALASFVTILGPVLIISGLLVSSLGTLIAAFGALATVITSFLSLPALIIAGFTGIGAAIAGSLALGFVEARRQSDESATQLAFRAFFWGENIILSFAEGMASAINAVIGVLIDLANAVTFWLQALSPPRLLPNIDKWGKATMQAWLDGFLQVDFGVFNTLSDRLEGFIRSLNLGDTQVVPEIREMRQALLDVVALFGETGEISEKAINKVASSIGKNNAVLKEYIKTFLQLEVATRAVAAAQAELNAINIKYDKLLDPIADQLQDIDNIRQDELDKLRIEELNAIIGDPRAPARVKELAQLELKQIALKKEQRTLEQARDTELDAANAKLQAAKAEQDALDAKLERLDAIITTQQKENSLIKEQIDLLERLAEAAKKAAGAADFEGRGGGITAGGGAASAARKALTDAQQRLADKLGIGEEDGPESLGSKILFAFNRLKEKILKIFEPTREQLEKLGKAWAPLVTFIIDGVITGVDVSNLDPADQKLFNNYIRASIEEAESDKTLVERLGTVLAGIITVGINNALGEIDVTEVGGKLISGIFDGIKRSVENIEVTKPLIGLILKRIIGGDQDAPQADDFLATSGFDAGKFGLALRESIRNALIDTKDAFVGEDFNLIDFLFPGLGQGDDGPNIFDQLIPDAGFWDFFFPDASSNTTFVDNILGALEQNDTIQKLQGAFENLDQIILQVIGGGSFGASPHGLLGFGGVMPGVGTLIESLINGALSSLDTKLDEIGTYVTNTLIPTLQDKLDTALQVVEDAIGDVAGIVEDRWDTAVGGINDFIQDTLLGTLRELINIIFGEGAADSLGATILRVIDAVLGPMETALNNLATAAQTFKNKLKSLWDFIRNTDWDIPWPWKQGSPSPFEQAMIDAASATNILVDSMDTLNATDIGRSASSGMSTGAAMSNLPVRGNTSFVNNTVDFGGQTINNGMDMGEFMLLVQQVVRNEL
jgi:TP901 family phage tail tape measure protein